MRSPSDSQTAVGSKKGLWAGYIVGGLLALFLAFTGVISLMKPAPVLEGFKKYGYPESAVAGIGLAAIASAVLYMIPRTSILGAILMTGYLGGATATHVRVGEPFYLPIIFGVLIWGGLFLRDERVRALIPLRS